MPVVCNKRIINRYYELVHRSKIEIHTKYAYLDNYATHLTKSKKRKLYDYYECDYCKNKVIISDNKKKSGIVIIPSTLTKRKPLKLVLCGKCINYVVKEFEEEYKWKVTHLK